MEGNLHQNVMDNFKNNETNNNRENEEKKKKKIKIIEINNTVHVALNIDNNYIYPTIVFLTSLFENRKATTLYDITILTNNMNKSYFKKINSLKEKYGDKFVKIHFINMKNDFDGVVTNTHISATAYYRIALPTVLPNVDRIIYTDVDVINFKDLTEMYNLELKDNIYLKGILDKIVLLSELRDLGVNSTKYFNSGIILINLKSMRINGVENRIRNFIYTHYLEHHDQTAMNAICYNNWEILPLKYAVICLSEYWQLVEFYRNQDKKYIYNEGELGQGFYDSTLLHYAGMLKPWEKKYFNKKKRVNIGGIMQKYLAIMMKF